GAECGGLCSNRVVHEIDPCWCSGPSRGKGDQTSCFTQARQNLEVLRLCGQADQRAYTCRASSPAHPHKWVESYHSRRRACPFFASCIAGRDGLNDRGNETDGAAHVHAKLNLDETG